MIVIENENFCLENILINEDIIIKGNNAYLKNIIMKGRIIIYSKNNYLEDISFCNNEGIVIYPTGKKNKIISSHFNMLQYGITIYGRENEIKGCFFCENEYPIVLLDDLNIVHNSYFFKNHHPIINKAKNRIFFNVFNQTEPTILMDSNKVLS